MLVPDLSARVTLLDRDDQVIAHLGEDPAWREPVTREKNTLRCDQKSAGWEAGKFLQPHDACCDAAGNRFVAEWVHTTRITKLRKLA